MASVVNKNLTNFNPNITKDRIEGNNLIISDGSHIIPTYNGYCVGLGKNSLFFLPLSGTTLIDTIEIQDGVGKLIITTNAIYRYNYANGEGAILVQFANTITQFSYGYIGAYYYFLCDGVLYQYDHLANQLEALSPVGFPESAVFLIATNNRLIVLSDEVVAWSAVGDGTNFTPNLGTGAGFQSLDSLSTGKGIALAAKKNGFLIFTTENVITATELSTALVYNFKEVSKHKLLNRACVATSTFGVIYFINEDKNLYSYEDLGSLGSGGFKAVSEDLLDYLNLINADITKLTILDTRLLTINYANTILGIDLVFSRLFKVKHSETNVVNFNFIRQSHFWQFNYRSVYDDIFNSVSYYGNQLHVLSSTDEFCASVNFYADPPISDSVILTTVSSEDAEFLGMELPETKFFDEDLMNSLLDEDLDDSSLALDLMDFDNTFNAYFEISSNCDYISNDEGRQRIPVAAEFEFAALHFSGELPVEETTVVTKVDTNMSSNKLQSVVDSYIVSNTLICDSTIQSQYDAIYNELITLGYDVRLFISSSTDAYGELPHHDEIEITDKYYAGKRLLGNIYTTGIYHTLKYLINGFCEITGIQFNLFKGGKIYDRQTTKRG